ncbi:MAG: NADH-quinone oxidoreductase subunit NuoH [Caldilinea sp.]|nr:NADH-quinone oxidoreductase subunit NuoH [Caldilineaceae bacterium]MCO5209712.1 NADH-quinone oxidoreductase subunit NuoH [Caldilinea sp.]MCB9114150.1 NADH-quinone oxidoreductase subunit NuoH [Caldilineaceae bacterium]MCB9125254.1 NADH-quinone oxidoreductase subunit NuoH [Caldilineaceae bacterium]MCW5843131.1 NADH-quinone oxidoreductase subunit NuoH [Caldilinea sp.]
MNWSDALIQMQYNLGAPQELSWLVQGITYFVGAFILANAALVLALVLIWITRKVISRIQDRIGPNRLGPFGLFQTIADAMKLLSKEDINPTSADTISYQIAPVLSVVGVIMALAVIPFGAGLIGADLNVGVLYLVALGSIGIMAALMAGWGSNNKYALLAGFRVVAQLLSYEIPMVLAMLAPVLLVNTMRMQELAQAQSLFIGPINLGIGWFVFLLPGAFLIYFISALAEGEQTPFDLLEAESELVAGFHIEYSGMKFAMFFLAQFLNSFFLGAIAVALFLGGWQGPFAGQIPLLGPIYFMAKTFFIYVVIQWIKGTFPRMRVDQMMQFAWKVLVPLVLTLILVQMVVMKLPLPGWINSLLVLVANIGVFIAVLNIMGSYFRREMVRTKRSFEPKSLIGTMQPVNTSSGD